MTTGYIRRREPQSFSGGQSSKPVLICFSHLRWDFVFQRPQHLMSRFAREYRLIVWEEPIYEATGEPRLDLSTDAKSGVTVAVPHLDPDQGDRHEEQLRTLLDELVATRAAGPLVRWYYTPMMLPFSQHLDARCTVYDCMDELKNFKFAPPELLPLEDELMKAADVVFTGGYSLYEAKRERHDNVHAFPSSVEVAHFAQARAAQADPADQAALARPRFGFYGVIDERVDLDLLKAAAEARPDWTFVMVGPVVKIDEDELPRLPNIAYLGGKDYAELPGYLSGWDVAMMPFAINEATRFISPTKTPEYLAAGKPVVSTPIKDVIRHYGELDGVQIARNPAEFIAACERALALPTANREWLLPVDALLSTMSWDETAAQMQALIAEAAAERRATAAPKPHYDVLVVGAGFAGSVMAERLANDAGKKVLVIDRRPHIAGNAYDLPNEDGILYHLYGPHIFHTNSEEIFAYLSRFTKWRPYEHKVLAQVRDQLVPMPINRTTLNLLYGANLQTDEEADAFLESRAEPVAEIKTSADVVVSKVGTELYQLFFQGYTRKQWGMDPSELDKSVTSRVPTRTNTDDRYFTDSFQAMPRDGFTRMFEAMLDHPNIELRLGVEYRDVMKEVSFDKLVFTGPIDEYFDHRYGKLPYRSLQFRHETVDTEVFQPVAVVNYPDEGVPYTRITEYKYLTGQVAPKTSITYEYPSAEGDPYYPIPRPENQALFKRYEALALAEPDVIFVGRLATYRYYNMDQVVGQALSTYRRMKTADDAAQEQVEGVVKRAGAHERPALFGGQGQRTPTRSGSSETTATPAE